MDPYAEVCKRFEDQRIRYLIVGVFGINFYARQAGQIITTADCDVLLPAGLAILRKALQTLKAMGFVFEAGGEPMPALDPAILKGVLRARAVVCAERPDARIDICTQIAGAEFEGLWRRHREFVVEGTIIRVGPLQALVKSKRLADRPKDRLFLEQHSEIIDSLLRRRKRGR
jgi:hypothetical protein